MSDIEYLNKNQILDYDLFIFDFDGTILDTEKYHCEAWNLALSELNNKDINISISDYYKFFHTLNSINQKIILKNFYGVEDYDKIYNRKHFFYNNLIKTIQIDFVKGAENFLNFLIKNNKKFIIVTNTSINYIKLFQEYHPILKKAFKIYTKEDFFNRKPNPECYLRVLNDFPFEKKIGFEDSYAGLHALYQVPDILPVLYYNKEYYYSNLIINNYPNVILLNEYNVDELNDNLLNQNFRNIESNKYISNILNHNIKELNKNFKNMQHIINSISIILKNISSENHIYLTGMGKSGYICKKSASTWQSLSIKASYIDLPNLPHGDFGIFRDNDILLLISNGGNTAEIIYILKYIKEILKKKINIISIVANSKSEMEKYSNFIYKLENII
jgi:D-arabinose 5-phosphate isomerase GutQ/beta-phosphoglucomutase-like phosphatase (HAD superfamily)